MTRRLLRIATMACIALMAQSVAARAADVVKIGVLNTSGDIAVHLAIEKGYFKEEGIEPELILFDASAKMIPFLGNGQLDVGGGATAVGLFNAIDRKVGLRIVAEKGRTEPGFIYQSFMIRKALIDSGRFKTWSDLKGLKFAQGGAGVGPLALLSEAAEKGGVKYADIEKVFMSFSQQVAALKSGAIDGSVMNEPYKTIVAQEGLAVEFAPTEVIRSKFELSLLFFGEQFRSERKDVARRFMRAFLKGNREYLNAIENGRWRTDGGADEVIAIFAKKLSVPEDLARKITPQAADPDGLPNVDSIRRDLAFFKSEGDVTNAALQVDDCIDLSFAEAAAKELGPYVKRK
ncbi:MAG: transporter substrate-binding protein [Hyphomicrobiales bacterium]|nr:transporter substrate-binding protein [Hyphomicrobiales bacterium]